MSILLAPALAFGQDLGSVKDDRLQAKALFLACNTKYIKGTPKPGDQEFMDQTCKQFMNGLVQGIFILQLMIRDNRQICLPEDGSVPVDEARQVFGSYILSHPDLANNSAGLVAALAIFDAHKCNQPTR